MSDFNEEFPVGQFDNSTTEKLLYLQHDKSHVFKNTSRVGFMSDVFEAYKNNRSRITLYRGLYVENISDFKSGDIYTFQRYQSFSEDLKIAEKFSKNQLIIVLKSHDGGFNYWKWLVNYAEILRQTDPQEFKYSDGEYIITAAQEETEWIFDIGTRIRIIRIEEKSPYTHIIAEM